MRRYLAALAAMLLPVALMGQVLADKAPANTLVYVGFKGTDALSGQYQASHLRAVIDGTDWNMVLSDKFHDQLAKLMAQHDQELADAWPAIVAAFKSALTHPIALSIGTSDKGQPTLALICDAANDAAAVLEKFKAAIPSGSTLKPQQVGKYVVLTDQPQAILQLLSGNDANAGLAGVPEFAAAMKQVDAQGALTVFVNTKVIFGLMAGKFRDPQAAQTMAALGLDQFKAVAASANFAGEGWQNRVFIMAPGARSGITALLDNKPITDATLKLVPATATRCSIFHADLARMLDTSRTLVAKVDPSAAGRFDQGTQMASNMLGVDLVTQVFPSLGDEWAVYTDPGIGGSQPMGMVIASRLRDPAKAEAALLQIQGKLLTFARGAADMKQLAVPSAERSVAGTKVRTISLPMISPSWAVRDGVLYIGLYPQVVAAAAEFTGSGKPSIAESPVLAQAARAAGTAPQSISYTDLPRAADTGYGFALLWSRYLGLLDLMGLETPTMPMPTLAVLKPHLLPAMAVTWSDADGWHMRSSEPFPGAQVLGTMMTSDFMGTSVPIATAILLPSLSRARESANQVKCASNMRQIGQGLLIYANGHNGKLPAELGDLLKEGPITVQVFVCPSGDQAIPPIVLQSPREEQAEWVSQSAEYIYLGTGLDNNRIDPKRPILYEKLEHHQRGANVLFGDGHVDFVDRNRLSRIIAPAQPAKN